MKKLTVAVIVIGWTALAGAETSPYAGQQTRAIKTLSDHEIEEYLNGRGLGYARAAELNHYPGPRHVLDLASELALTAEQTKQTRDLFEAMRSEAIPLGRELVDKERELDRRFADGTIDETSLAQIVAEIGRIQASLRRVHLSAHLAERAVLTEHQRHLYDELRGYTGQGGQVHDHSSH